MAITSSHPAQLTDAQRAILTAAAQRPDLGVVQPARLKGGAAQKVARALVDKGLVREIRAKGEQPVWRKDESNGRSFALVLTKAGRALAARPVDGDQPQAPATPSDAVAPAAEPAPAAAPLLTIPRSGSKLAAVIALLGREQGSSVSELMDATGWLPHTTRAALTGLRKRGYALTREAGEGGAVYRISSTAPAAAA